MGDDILNSAEVEFFIKSLKPCRIDEIGTVSWFDEHLRLERLRQQCIFEAGNSVDEKIKDIVILEEKLPVLIHEAIIIQIWREQVFEVLSGSIERPLQHGFIGYMILYHECTAINFLQILMHHKDTIQSLGDCSLDLVDYAVAEIVQLCCLKPDLNPTSDELLKLIRDQREIQLNIGLATIAIVCSLGEYLDELNISTMTRLYCTHDIPLLLVNLLDVQPWRIRDEDTGHYKIFIDGLWQDWDHERVSKSEAQCWLALRGFLLHDAAKQHYEITEYRKQQLTKIQKYLHERVIDQISPLIELKQYLSNISICNPGKVTRTPIIIESIPEIRIDLLKKRKAWKKLAERHTKLIIDGDRNEVVEIAKRIAETYDADKMAKVDVQPTSRKVCELCGGAAFKRCSRCHTAWYCGRECQVKAWSSHKMKCEEK